MKIWKMLLPLILMVLCLVLLPSKAEAATVASGTGGDYVTWTLDDQGVLVFRGKDGYSGRMGDDTWGSLPWLDYRSSIKSVIIKDSVYSICANAFANCNNLVSVTIGNGVTEIEHGAFAYCTQLLHITIPSSVTGFGRGLFCGCSKLTSVVFSGTVNKYVDFSDYFEGCTSLTSVTLPKGLGKIGANMFLDCWKLASVNIPTSVTSIGDSAFAHCNSLSSITIPNNVTSIGERAFEHCYDITEVTIGSKVKSIGKNAFSGCERLASITIPASVTSIGEDAFAYCDMLTRVWVDPNNAMYTSDDGVVLFNKDKTTLMLALSTLSGEYDIPASVTSIGNSAFESCSNLTNITIPESVISIGNSAFESCYSLTSITIPESVVSIGNSAFRSCYSLTNVTIPNSITSIANWTFAFCDNLSTVSIPHSVTNINNYAFYGCSSLADVYYGGTDTQKTNISIGSNNTCLTSANWHYKLSVIAGGTCGEDLIWELDDEGTLTISGTGAMEDYSDEGAPWYANKKSIKTVLIVDGVTGIGWGAFGGCTSLESVAIPGTVTTVQCHAFYCCENLTSIMIPASVTYIHSQAFDGCSSLAGIWVDAENPAYCSDDNGILFNKDKTQLIQTPVTLSGAYRIPDGVVYIGYAFQNCRGLRELYIPASVTDMDSYGNGYESLTAFWVDPENTAYSNDEYGVLFNKDKTWLLRCPPNISCENDTYIIPDGADVSGGSFEECAGIKKIVLPGSTTDVGVFAFSDFPSLETVVLPQGLKTIGYGAFYGCYNLRDIEIPNGTTTIDQCVFYECTSLRAISVPKSVIGIGYGAFEGCTSLSRIAVLNPNCSISTTPEAVGSLDDEISVVSDQAMQTLGVPGTVTICGYPDSTAEQIANAYGCYFEKVIDPNNSLNSGACGENLTWVFDGESGILRVCGSGSMKDYALAPYTGTATSQPWSHLDEQIDRIIIEDGVTSIGNYAFMNQQTVRDVQMPETLTEIGHQAFACCWGLTKIEIPNGVVNIKRLAFFACENITAVLIPSSVIDIGEGAFYGCIGLTDVSYDGEAEQWAEINVGGSNEELTEANIVCWYDGGAALVTANGVVVYPSLLDAISNVDSGYVRLNGDVFRDFVVSKSIFLDLNGYSITGDITVAEGVTLYALDSATADYTADNRGRIVGTITGDLAKTLNTPKSAYGHSYKYLALEEEESVWSFHRYYLTVKSVVLKPYIKGEGYIGTAVDYKTVFKCNDVMAQYVTAYGTKLVGDSTVYADYMENGYSLRTGADNTNEQSTWLSGIFKTTNSAEVNATNALRKPTARAYITLTDGTEITSAGVQRSLQDMIVYANGLSDLTDVEKAALGIMYDLFKDVLGTWTEVDVFAIKQYGTSLV